jgi:hypothetical protein
MKLFWVILLTLFAHANQNGVEYRQMLYSKVFHLLIPSKTVQVYTDPQNEKFFLEKNHFKIVDTCDAADIVFHSHENFIHHSDLNQSCKNKPIFVTNYDDFTNLKGTIGAFYYRKGRPQLKLNQKSLDAFGIKIDDSLLKYVE